MPELNQRCSLVLVRTSKLVVVAIENGAGEIGGVCEINLSPLVQCLLRQNPQDKPDDAKSLGELKDASSE